MRGAALAAALLMLAVALPAAAQTYTPTPSDTPPPSDTPDPAAGLGGLPQVIIPTGSSGGTYTATATLAPTMTTIPLTSYWNMFRFPTPSPFAFQQSTLDFASWLTITPGGAFVPPTPPNLANTTSNDRPAGFVAVSDFNLGQLMIYIIRVAIIFFGWFAINFPTFVSAARWLVIILIILYGIFRIWKGSKYAPPNADGVGFGDTFELGGRYYYYTRGYRQRMREGKKKRS